MNLEIQLEIVKLVYAHANELKLTNNEVLMAERALGLSTFPVLKVKSHETGATLSTDPVNHLVNTFHAIIRERYPAEYSAIFTGSKPDTNICPRCGHCY